MGAFASGLQSAGQAASDFGQAKFDFSNWQQQQRANRLNEIIQGVRLQQIQQQLKQAQQPQPYGTVPTPGGGTEGITFDPATAKYSGQPLIQGVAQYDNIRPDKQGRLIGQRKDTGAWEIVPTPQGSTFDTPHAENPVNDLIAEGIAASKKGDDAGAQKAFDLAQRAAGSKRAPSNPTLFSLIQRKQRGDPEAAAELQEYQHMQNQMRQQYGLTRAMYTFGSYINGQGQLEAVTAFDAVQRQKNGEPLTPSGHLSTRDAIAIQQYQAEMGNLTRGTPARDGKPAIPPLRDTLKAFDNPSDRLIYAEIGGSSGHPAYGQEVPWLRNVIHQVLQRGLSDEGRQMVVSLARLNETIGRLRSVLALPATDNAMQMTLALAPGPQMPDSKMAGMYLDNIEAMGDQAGAIPIYQRGVAQQPSQSPAASGQPPPGAKIRDLRELNEATE